MNIKPRISNNSFAQVAFGLNTQLIQTDFNSGKRDGQDPPITNHVTPT